MAYSIDVNGDIVINGSQNGIGASPYSGLTDLKSVNIDSISGEASVAFSTGSVFKVPAIGSSGNPATANVFTGGGGVIEVLGSLLAEEYQWIMIVNPGTSGLSANTPYLLVWNSTQGINEAYGLYTSSTGEFPGTVRATISNNNVPVTYYTITPALPKYMKASSQNNFMVDANGLVWSDRYKTLGGGTVVATNSWVWIGNSTDATSNGNGLEIYKTIHNGTGAVGVPISYDEWLFVWRNSSIDYTQLISANSNSAISWVDGWNPNTGTSGNGNNYLQTPPTSNYPHTSIVTLPNMVIYTDFFYVSTFFQNIPTLASSNYVGFDPLTKATYFFNTFNILPPTDIAQCLTFINQYVLIGGSKNYIYPWNAASLDKQYTAPIIILPENNIVNMVTIGNNAYLFAGNRGIIYITNGSQASFLTKVPDHISGSVEPLYSWGGASYNKNRLYFGINASLQAGGNATGYGGVWCMDTNTIALWNIGQMSYGSYAGYVSAMANTVGQSAAGNTYGPNNGYDLMMGWSDGGNTGNYGIDVSISTPYINGQSMVVSDLIPIGTLLKKTTPYGFEFKLAMPLQTGESVQIRAGNSLSDYVNNTMTTVFTTVGDGVLVSDNSTNHTGTTVENQQWLIVQAILTGIASNPSYNRITELRVIGDTIKSNVPSQPYSLQ